MIRKVGIIGLAAALLIFAACNSETIAAGVGGLAFEATAAVGASPPQNVVVTAKITNISTTQVDVNYGGCAVTPVFHTGSLDGPVAYDPRPTPACATVALVKTLDPDQAFTVTGSAAPSLPSGKYYVEAVIVVNGETTSVGAGTVTF